MKSCNNNKKLWPKEYNEGPAQFKKDGHNELEGNLRKSIGWNVHTHVYMP